MRKSGKTTALVATLLCGITGSLARHPIAAKGAMPVATARFPIISKIVARHYTVIVAAGPDAPLYTVTSDNGQQLTNQITLASMKQSNPDLFNRISPALAMGDVDAAVDIDASIGN